jgi:hypothetical protein
VLDGALGFLEAADADAGPHSARGERVELVDPHVAGLVGVGEVDAWDVGVDAAEDGHDAVLLGDVVLVLAPAPRRGPGHPGDADQREQDESASQCRVTAWSTGCVARGLGVGLDRERDPRGQVVGDLCRHGLDLAGVS